MKLLWAPNIDCVRAFNAVARETDTDLKIKPEHHGTRVHRPFPLLIDSSGQICREAFEFLYDLSVKGSSESAKTLSTYAESLCDWFTFGEQQSPPFQIPTMSRLLRYRGHLSGTDVSNKREGNELSRRTINLRLTVVNEYRKFVAPDTNANGKSSASETETKHKKNGESFDRSAGRRRLLVKVAKTRPRTLQQDATKALVRTLPLPHRLAFQWQLCTGLRRGSIVALTLGHIDELTILTFLVQGDAAHVIVDELTKKYGKPDTRAGSFEWTSSDTQVLLIPPAGVGMDAQITFTYIGGPNLDSKDT